MALTGTRQGVCIWHGRDTKVMISKGPWPGAGIGCSARAQIALPAGVIEGAGLRGGTQRYNTTPMAAQPLTALSNLQRARARGISGHGSKAKPEQPKTLRILQTATGNVDTGNYEQGREAGAVAWHPNLTSMLAAQALKLAL